MSEGRDMRERGGGKMKKYIDGIYSMLEEMEECLEEGNFGERDDYGYGDRDTMGERRSMRTGRYIR